jgi:hypothetical protein
MLLCVVVVCAGACSRGADEIREAERRTGNLDRVPPAAIGSGNDPATGLPVGYPPGLPLVPGGRAISGGVDPGVIRTATLVYEGMTVATYAEGLRVALEANGQRIISTFDTPSGSKQIRVDLGAGTANLIVADDQGRVRVDVTAMDRAPRNR